MPAGRTPVSQPGVSLREFRPHQIVLRQEMLMLIKTGETAPDFELKDSSGSSFRLSDMQGFSNIMLVFYPKDMTSG